ncbi:MAG: AMP-binding protein [Solirubrobacterales bacterium]
MARYSSVSLDHIARPFGEKERGITFVDADGDRMVLTYDELAWRAASAGSHLQELGVVAGDRVAITIENNWQSVSLVLGVWTVGASIISLPPPRHGGMQLYEQGGSAALRSLGCKRIFGSRTLARLLGPGSEVTDINGIDFFRKVVPPDTRVEGDALIQFTSGSTASPKGVVLSAETLSGHVSNFMDHCGLEPENDRGVSWLPLCHDMGLVGCLLPGLVGRGDMILVDPRWFIRNPASWMELCAEQRATLTAGPDFAFRIAAKVDGFARLEGRLDNLNICLTGAEKVSWETMTTFAEVFEDRGFAREALMPAYGMAEATLGVSFTEMGRGPRRGKRGVALGEPMPGVEVELVDGDGSRIDEDGVEGTVRLKSPWLLDHYLTPEGEFDPRDANGWFVTKDIAVWDEGELVVLGRSDETVIVGGRNVFAEDLEEIAVGAAGGMALLAAAFRPSREEQSLDLVLEVVPSPDFDAQAVARAVRASAVEALDFRPSTIAIVAPAGIPRTTSGKPRRSRCREMLANREWTDETLLVVDS